MKDFTPLLKYCETPTQTETIKAVIDCNGNKSHAAKKLKKDLRGVQRTIKSIEKRAAINGDTPEHFVMNGSSTMYDNEGNVKLTWIKEKADEKAKIEAIHEAIEKASIQLPKLPKINQPKQTLEELCTVYTITDFHYGMYAWSKETGGDWDTEIAQSTLINAVNDMMTGSPNSETAVFNQQGDFLHWDGIEAVTPTSGHVLDADTRFHKLADLALSSCIQIIGLLLQKHKRVHVLMVEGNHDLAGSAWLQVALKHIFIKNERVTIDDTCFPFYAYQHGQIMLGFHHGHKVRNKSLPALFASEPRYREMWGQCKYTYIHTGHYHSTEQDMAEHGGAIVERHPTLAARDAYAARGGYMSWRAAKAITYHKTKGEFSRAVAAPIET